MRALDQAAVVDAALVALGGGLLGSVTEPMVIGTGLAVLAAMRTAMAWRRPGGDEPPVAAGLAVIGGAEQEDPNLAVIDALTGLANRRGLERTLDGECRRAACTGTPVGVIVLGIRDFELLRQVNGAEAAREVLRQTGRCLRDALGGDAIVGRWAGSEFVAVLPRVRPDVLPLLAERFRRMVESQPVAVPGGGKLPIRAAVGWSASPRDGISGSFLVAAARGRGSAGVPALVLSAA